MKLIVAIVQDYDCDRLLQAVSGAGLGATRIASTGGFLRTGNTTVLMGVDDDSVESCLDLIRGACQARVERPPDELVLDLVEWGSAGVAEVTIGGAVVFVVRVGQFVRLDIPDHPTMRVDAEGGG
ncbi:MAG: cyclic-di-AMP receptor [Thermomicrobiales bacterium]